MSSSSKKRGKSGKKVKEVPTPEKIIDKTVKEPEQEPEPTATAKPLFDAETQATLDKIFRSGVPGSDPSPAQRGVPLPDLTPEERSALQSLIQSEEWKTYIKISNWVLSQNKDACAVIPTDHRFHQGKFRGILQLNDTIAALSTITAIDDTVEEDEIVSQTILPGRDTGGAYDE